MEPVPRLDLGPVTVHFGEKTGKWLHLLPNASVHVHEADVEAARSWAGLSRHYGYPPPILDALRVKIARDFHYAPRPDAIAYADGAQWDLGGGVRVRALHFPGHTAGHCVLLVEPEGIAFIGDIDLSGFGPYYGDASSNLADFRRSLARLPALPARAWITSHHRGVYTDRAAFEEALAAFAAKMLQMLAAGPQTLDELVRQRLLYPPHADDLWIDCAEARSIGQHLDELAAAGRVVHEPADGRFRLVAGQGPATRAHPMQPG